TELPPPYTAIASPDASGVPVINCRVCQSLINLDGKLHQHVVKRTVCNEATPIKNPPSGKKYVRCQCNCLLICKDTSRKIGCPRPNCCYGTGENFTEVTHLFVEFMGYFNCNMSCV
uniref:Phosphatidylinositol-4,5-bisphosphate 4-phosphatase n=1 Tax=Chrysolophus pictus TaxID=9089 RepID=A0A8C3LZE3_CHRPC